MTNEEEKILEEILDEENDITLEEAAEEAEDLQKEVREEIRLDPEDVPERPVLRGGLRGAADPNMIQKHIDNFLAMLCGETPVDSNVRTSAEYWLKRLAEGEGGSTKKLYRHVVKISTYNVCVEVITQSAVAFTTATFAKYLYDIGYQNSSAGLQVNGYIAFEDGKLKWISTVFSSNGTQPRGSLYTAAYTISDGEVVVTAALESHNVSITDTVTELN